MIESFRIPIIRMKGLFIVSIQMALDDALVMQLKEDVASVIAQEGGKGLIVDVSGIDIMDSYISRTIYDLAKIAKLMGVTTVLSGMDPMIAMTLVEMGLEMEGVKTCRDLESAYDFLTELREGEDEDERGDEGQFEGGYGTEDEDPDVKTLLDR